MVARCRMAFADYDDFNLYVPKWYTERYREQRLHDTTNYEYSKYIVVYQFDYKSGGCYEITL